MEDIKKIKEEDDFFTFMGGDFEYIVEKKGDCLKIERINGKTGENEVCQSSEIYSLDDIIAKTQNGEIFNLNMRDMVLLSQHLGIKYLSNIQMSEPFNDMIDQIMFLYVGFLLAEEKDTYIILIIESNVGIKPLFQVPIAPNVPISRTEDAIQFGNVIINKRYIIQVRVEKRNQQPKV